MNTFNSILNLFFAFWILYGFTTKCLFSEFRSYAKIFFFLVLIYPSTVLEELSSIILATLEIIIFKIAPCFLIILSFIAFTLGNNLEFNVGFNLYFFISLLFFLSNLFTIHLLFTRKEKSSNSWNTFKTLLENPILIIHLFVLVIMMYTLRNSIINSAIPMDSRSIIVIFYVVISLLPLTTLYFTIIRVALHFTSASLLNFHKLYYNNSKKSVNGSIILYIFIYMIFIRLMYIAFAINFDLENYGLLTAIGCNLTHIGNVFMEKYNSDYYDYSSFEYNSGSQNHGPNSPNPGPQNTAIPLPSDGEDSNDKLQDIQDSHIGHGLYKKH